MPYCALRCCSSRRSTCRFRWKANKFARGVVAPILTPAGRLDQVTVSAFYRPNQRLGSNYVEAAHRPEPLRDG